MFNVPVSCNTVNTCHPHAQCVFVPSRRQYQCQCNAGYEGDGFECAEIGKFTLLSILNKITVG
jgi:nidogen (entactin)